MPETLIYTEGSHARKRVPSSNPEESIGRLQSNSNYLSIDPGEIFGPYARRISQQSVNYVVFFVKSAVSIWAQYYSSSFNFQCV